MQKYTDAGKGGLRIESTLWIAPKPISKSQLIHIYILYKAEDWFTLLLKLNLIEPF